MKKFNNKIINNKIINNKIVNMSLTFLIVFLTTLTIGPSFPTNANSSKEIQVLEEIQNETLNEYEEEIVTIEPLKINLVSLGMPQEIKTNIQPIDIVLSPDRTYKKQYTTEEIDKFITAICIENNVDKNLILGIIETESSFRVYTTSSANCKGLMQLHSKYYSSPHGLYDAKENIELGVKTISRLISKYGDIEKALVCYNMGEYGKAKYISSSKYSRKVVRLMEEYKNGKTWSIRY